MEGPMPRSPTTRATPPAARARCTAYEPPDEQLTVPRFRGPDTGWVRLTDEKVASFCKDAGKALQHRGRQNYDHVCAYHGAWAFDANDGSPARCVAFLHYTIPKKANKLLGEVDASGGAKLFEISGDALLERYNQLKAKGHQVHVWRRKTHGEIAIDFCLGHGEPRKKSPLSRFLSRFK